MSIDCHIHLFDRNRSAIAKPRHVPTYDAEYATVKALGAAVGVRRFVLVQTSFMGTDNSLLMRHLQDQPDTFRGVFILGPATSSRELQDLKAQGVVGIRLNLLGVDLENTLTADQLGLIERCSEQGLSVGLHDDASRLVDILDRIDGRAEKLVVDHFGRPESLALAQDDPVYENLLEKMAANGSYVKISAPYRSPNMNPAKAYEKLKTALGYDRLLWASDWPWTQSESALTYAQWAEPFHDTDAASAPAHRNLPQQLAINAERFYGFSE